MFSFILLVGSVTKLFFTHLWGTKYFFPYSEFSDFASPVAVITSYKYCSQEKQNHKTWPNNLDLSFKKFTDIQFCLPKYY